jgi:hypothetical protein
MSLTGSRFKLRRLAPNPRRAKRFFVLRAMIGMVLQSARHAGSRSENLLLEPNRPIDQADAVDEEADAEADAEAAEAKTGSPKAARRPLCAMRNVRCLRLACSLRTKA